LGTEHPALAVNLYTPLAIILFFTMLTTLRFSIAGTLKTANPVLRVLTHPAWLAPLILEGGYVLGAFYHGALSPWPPATFHIVAEKAGFWAAAAATEGAITVDIWLLWATATTFKIFSPPHDARMVKYYYVVNFAIGAYLMARFLHVIDMGKVGIIPG
jgi:hypothetical protein